MREGITRPWPPPTWESQCAGTVVDRPSASEGGCLRISVDAAPFPFDMRVELPQWSGLGVYVPILTGSR
jgi:hypothetical protein